MEVLCSCSTAQSGVFEPSQKLEVLEILQNSLHVSASLVVAWLSVAVEDWL